MLNMLIVDDEPIIADGLFKLVEAHFVNRMHIHRVYSVQEAIKHSERIKLDIVLSDVLMPEMNGLQLQEQILLRWSNCQFIFITGHDDFPYIQQALRNGSVSYILKTERDESILDAIDRAMDRIDKAYQMQTLVKDAQRQRNAALPLMRDQLFTEWIRGDKGTVQDMSQRMAELEFSLDIRRPVLPILIQFEEPHPAASIRGVEPFLLMDTIISRLLSSVAHMRFQLSVSQQAFLFQGEDPYETIVLGTLEQIQDIYNEKTNQFSNFFALRAPVLWHEIDWAFYRLGRALRQNTGQSVVQILDLTGTDESLISEDQHLEAMRRHLSSRCETSFFQDFDCLARILTKEGPRIAERRTMQALRMLALIGEVCADLDLVQRIDVGEYFKVVSAPMVDQGPWTQCVEQLKILFQRLFVALNTESDLRNRQLISRLHAYIDEHLQEDLSLTRLGEVACYNSSYLSTVYKNLTGQSLIDYINQVRINRAKQLLAQSEMRVRQIALTCGFESQQYFHRLFKKKTGLTPNEYREQRL